MSKYSNMVVIISKHGEKYVGTVNGSPLFIDGSKPVELLNARLLITRAQAVGTPTGEIVGLKNFMCIANIDMAKKPIPKLYLYPSAWYFLTDLPDSYEDLDQLFKQADDNDITSSAKRAGIHIPGRH
jgi:hypothetical protein